LGGVKYSMGSRPPKLSQINAEPGPGKYFEKGVPSTLSGPKISLKGKLRTKTEGDDIPGPDKYDTASASNRVKFNPPSFSMAKRTDFREREKDSIPGPGAHNIESINPIGKSGPRISMTGKPKLDDRILRHQSEFPGAGHYGNASNSLIGTTSPKFSMGKRFRDGIEQGYFEAPRTVVRND